MGETASVVVAHDPGGRSKPKWPVNSVVKALFSDCGRYRYWLSETWDADLPPWAFLMMNPSVAGIEHSDPTIQKTGRIARIQGAGAQWIVNTGALRMTNPDDLSAFDDAIGPDNEMHVENVVRYVHGQGGKIICAYGKPPKVLAGAGPKLARRLVSSGIPLHVLRLGKTGIPWHPLYVPDVTQPIIWEVSR